MINVKQLGDFEFEISWDENDPKESVFNHYTKEDFIQLVKTWIENYDENEKPVSNCENSPDS